MVVTTYISIQTKSSNYTGKSISTLNGKNLQLAKSLGITILLAVVVLGMGHIYLGFVKRGITILVIGIVLAITATLFMPIPLSWIVISGYSVWQIVDAYRHYK